MHALTHKSYSKKHNERMEFLGDSILNTSITSYLFRNFPEYNEGVLSRIRASLVKGETLAEIARGLGLGELLLLGPGELKSGGYQRESILADALESIIGAAYLEAGYERAEALVIGLYEKRLSKEAVGLLDKDPKTRLQEHLQSLKLPLPNYEIVRTEGNDHNQVFWVRCHIESLGLSLEASGKSRRYAERKVAEKVLGHIGNMK